MSFGIIGSGMGSRPYQLDEYFRYLQKVSHSVEQMEMVETSRQALKDALHVVKNGFSDPAYSVQIVPELSRLRALAPGFHDAILSEISSNTPATSLPELGRLQLNKSFIEAKDKWPQNVLKQHPQLKGLSGDSLAKFALDGESEALLAILQNYLDAGISTMDELTVVAAILGMIGHQIPENMYVKIVEMLFTFINTLPVDSMEPEQAIAVLTELNHLLSGTGVKVDIENELDIPAMTDALELGDEIEQDVSLEKEKTHSHPPEEHEVNHRALEAYHAYFHHIEKPKHSESKLGKELDEALAVLPKEVTQAHQSEDKQEDDTSDSGAKESTEIADSIESGVADEDAEILASDKSTHPVEIDLRQLAYYGQNYGQKTHVVNQAAGVSGPMTSPSQRLRRVDRIASQFNATSKNAYQPELEQVLINLMERHGGKLLNAILDGIDTQLSDMLDDHLNNLDPLQGLV